MDWILILIFYGMSTNISATQISGFISEKECTVYGKVIERHIERKLGIPTMEFLCIPRRIHGYA